MLRWTNPSGMHHTLGLILRRDEWGEADWLVTALSEDFGKIRLRAQGARRSAAKLRGHLEPGAVSALSFVVGRHGYRLTAARLLEFFPTARASLPTLAVLSAILADLDANLMEERHGARELFATAREAVRALEAETRPEAMERLRVWFAARLAFHLGLLPPPFAREADGLKALIALAGLPITEAIRHDVPAVQLSRELTDFGRAVGISLRPLPAPLLPELTV